MGLIGGAAAWPIVARSQPQTMPLIGFLSGRSQEEATDDTSAFNQGLQEMGYRVGRNVAIEYRWAEGRNELLPDLAADLVRRQVAVLAAVGGNNSALAAKRATATIPIIFTSSADPVKVGLVASLSHPGGNVTGVSWFDAELGPKQLQVLSELVPKGNVVLVANPSSPEVTDQRETVQEAARALGWQLQIIAASGADEIDQAFAAAKRQGANAIIVSSDPFLDSRRKQIVELAALHAIPTISGGGRDWVASGGLISYGSSVRDAYRRAGLQAGRLLRGVKPMDLPVDRSTRTELAINLTTAGALGLTVPDKLLARADEVIE